MDFLKVELRRVFLMLRGRVYLELEVLILGGFVDIMEGAVGLLGDQFYELCHRQL